MPSTSTVELRPYLSNKQAIRILDAARDLFVRQGPAGFSARRVAKDAGLSLGSVQHVFPTTSELLAATIGHVRDGYDSAYRAMEKRLPFSAEERLAAVIEYLVADLCKKDTRRYFLGFWALSCQNEQAHSSMCEAYDWQLKRLAGFVAAARPGLSDDRLIELARHITALIEGMLVLVGMSERQVTARSPVMVALRAQIWSMINDGAGADVPAAKSTGNVRRRPSAGRPTRT
jgi:AcrR family transcriptional regulator